MQNLSPAVLVDASRRSIKTKKCLVLVGPHVLRVSKIVVLHWQGRDFRSHDCDGGVQPEMLHSFLRIWAFEHAKTEQCGLIRPGHAK